MKILDRASGSLALLVYLGLMPTLCGGFIAGYALMHQEWLKSFSTAEILSINLLFSLVLAIGWIPTTFFSLLSGYLWGWECVPFVCMSYTMASLFGYYGSTGLDNGQLIQLLNEKFPVQQIVERLKKSSFWLTVFCRLSPVFPFAVMNAVFAIVKYPIGVFVGGGLVGMLPRTLFAIYLGQRLSHVSSVQQLKSDYNIWASILLVIASFIGIGWIGKKQLG